MAVGLDISLEFTLRSFESETYREIEPRLASREVHVWSLAVNDGEQDLSEFHRGLSPDERERSVRFRFETHRAQYVKTRGTLRLLLAHYLDARAAEISFLYSSYGKPGLLGLASKGLEFNVSHTEGMAIFGFARGRRIGVDIEKVRADFEAGELAERFFSPAERTSLSVVPTEARHAAFFRIWTRKEAYTKALGEGLSHSLQQFDVSLDDAARLVATRPQASEAQRWRLENLNLGPMYAAAVAVETGDPLISARYPDSEPSHG